LVGAAEEIYWVEMKWLGGEVNGKEGNVGEVE
jgi:hypothetical protein